MEKFKNQSDLIISIDRPLFELTNDGVAAIIVTAGFMAKRAHEMEDQESFATKLLWVTSHNMLEQAELEIAKRN